MRIDIDTKKRYALKILDPTDQEGFFYPAFRKITKEVKNFMEDVADFQGNHPEDMLRFQRNNIFSFCASRGQGKTSALLSFGDYLASVSQKQEENQKQDKSNVFAHAQFHTLPFVDPTLLEAQDSIIKTILSRMFHVLHMKEKEWYGSCTSARVKDFEKNKYAYGQLLKLFSACFESVDVIKQDQSSTFQEHQDNLEQLSLLGDSANLRVQLHELVEAYLDFLFDCGTGEKFLVISLDDTDMNVKKTFDIMEDIRKYLMLPSVIVLLATDLTQLEECVEQHFLGEFQTSLGINEKKCYPSCQRLTQNYMGKFLPIAHRIHLPDITTSVTDSLSSVVLSINGSDPIAYDVALFQMVQEKVGLYLATSEGVFHSFLPKTFRNLYAFIIFLEGLQSIAVPYQEDIPKGASTALLQYLLFQEEQEDDCKIKEVEHQEAILTLWKWNLKEFSDYLTQEWARDHFSEEEAKIFQEISVTPPSSCKENLVKILHQQSCFLEDEMLTWQSLADTRYMIELYRKYTKEVHYEDKTIFCDTLHLYLSLLSMRLLVAEWLEKSRKNEQNLTMLDPQKGILAFTGGGEIPWKLDQSEEAYQVYGDFPLDIEVLNRERGTLQDPEKKALVKMCLSMPRPKKEAIIFDPIHLHGIFSNKENAHSQTVINTISSETTLDLLRILLNWDLTKALLETLNHVNHERETDMDKVLEFMFHHPQSSSSWTGLHVQHQYFYQCVSLISQRFYGDTSNHPTRSLHATDVLLPHHVKLGDTFFLWELMFLSSPMYQKALRKKLKEDLKVILEHLSLEHFSQKSAISLQVTLALVRSEIETFSQGQHVFGSDYGSQDFLLKIIDDSTFFVKYMKILEAYSDFFEYVQDLSEDDSDFRENVPLASGNFQKKYQDLSEELFAMFPEEEENEE